MILVNIFLDNPLVNIHGPTFLFVYFIIILIVYTVGYYYKIKLKDSYTSSSINIATLPEPDPYMIAYLRAGVNETSKLVAYNLLERGYFEPSLKKESMRQKSGHPPISNLNELEKIYFEHINSSRRTEDVVDSPALLKAVNEQCSKMAKENRFDELFYNEKAINEYGYLTRILKGILLLIGGYKIIVALITGYTNVFFLLGMVVISIFLINRVLSPGRLTIAGEKYIKELQEIYKTKYSQGIKNASTHYQILLAGILGVSIFTELGYGYLVNYKRTKNIHYSIDGSCGSASCGGGSCGGGCGGCGG